jgi:hypothetical protein
VDDLLVHADIADGKIGISKWAKTIEAWDFEKLNRIARDICETIGIKAW